MNSSFIDLPTENGNAKLIWDKVKFSAIIPTGMDECVLNYDGISIKVKISADDLARRLESDPRVSIENFQKSKWIGEHHDGYSHKKLWYFVGLSDNEYRVDRVWNRQFFEVDIFQLPRVVHDDGKVFLTICLRIVVFAQHYESDPFGPNGGYWVDPKKDTIERVGVTGLDDFIILDVGHDEITDDFLHIVVGKFVDAHVCTRSKYLGEFYTLENHKVYDVRFKQGNDRFFIADDYFPAKHSSVTFAEYESRLSEIKTLISVRVEREIAQIHSESRIVAARAQSCIS